jgi:hypothetical protein
MPTLDERLDEARASLELLPIRTGTFEPAARVSRSRRRSRVVVGAAILGAAAAATGLIVLTTHDARHTLTPLSPPTNPSVAPEPTNGSVVDAPSPTNGSVVPPPATTAAAATTTTTTTAPPRPQGAPAAVPTAFGGNGLVLLPGAWGTGVTVTTDGASLTVDADQWHAVLTDAGPGDPPHYVGADDFSSWIDDQPRLGPLGPLVDVSTGDAGLTASVPIGGRHVNAVMTGVSLTTALDLLRSITTVERARIVRPTDTTTTVPDVTGLDYREATDVLGAAGLRAVWVLAETDATPIGGVVGSTPTAGGAVASGSVIRLDVAMPVLRSTHRLTSAKPFQLVVSPQEPVYDWNATHLSFGFVADHVPDAPPSGPRYPGMTGTEQPVVFLHGELVGTFRLGVRENGWPSVGLTDLVDPAWTPVEVTNGEPAPPIAITQTVDFHGITIGAPADWTIADPAYCPQTNTVVVLSDSSATASCAHDAAGPWVTIGPAPSGQTPCESTDLNGLQACAVDVWPDRTTEQLLLPGTDVMITLHGSQWPTDVPLGAIRNSIAGGRPWAEPTTALIAFDAVRSLLAADCDRLAGLVGPSSSIVVGCATLTPDGATVVDGWSPAQPRDLEEDSAHDLYSVYEHGGPRKWYVDLATAYDGATHEVAGAVYELIAADGTTVIAPTP